MRAGVVAFLEGPQLVNLAFVCRDWRRAACADQALARLETVCFFVGTTFRFSLKCELNHQMRSNDELLTNSIECN